MANKTTPLIDEANNNVGIGTVNILTSKLQVGGNIAPDAPMTYSVGTPQAYWSSSYVDTSVGNVIKVGSITSSVVSLSAAQFAPSASLPAWSEGTVFYDPNVHTLAVYNENKNIVHDLGRETLFRVYNPNKGAIPSGMPVYISQSFGGIPQIVPAIADGTFTNFNVCGVTTTYISASAYGYVTALGIVHGTTQSAFPVGTPLFLSSTNSGSYSTIPPTASYFERVFIGFVVNSSSAAGVDILVDINPYSYGSITASYALSASIAATCYQASSASALFPTIDYAAKSLTTNFLSSSNASVSGSFFGTLNGTVTTASYVATASVALLAYDAQTADFSLDSNFAYSASHADTCSVYITNYVTASVLSSSYASGSATASYVAMGRAMVLCSAYTPVLVGADAAEIVVPYNPDGSTVMTWNVKRLVWRAQVAETIQSVINIEKSTGNGVFLPTTIGSVTLPSSAYEAASSSYATVNSGDKVRFNVITLGQAQNWTIIVEISNA